MVTCDMNTWKWDDTKPYVSYGEVIVDSCTLEIAEGARIYVHGEIVFNGKNSYSDGVLYIGKNGRLEVNGTAEDPVYFQTDRLEKDYRDRIGQWGRIHIAAERRGNRISNTLLYIDGVDDMDDYMAELKIDHSR